MGHDANECKFSGYCGAHPPQWFQIGEPLLWPTLHAVIKILDEKRTDRFDLDIMPQCAAIHLMHALETSIDTNLRGRHTIAIGLVRQCVEALTLVDVGLQKASFRDPLLEAWANDKMSPGKMRQELQKNIWPRYGCGLWNESWIAFFGEFAKAVQPYAHYTYLLQGWQFAAPPGEQLRPTTNGHHMFIAQVGPNTYDGLKATRITLLHCLLGWTVARILLAKRWRPGRQIRCGK